MKRPSQIILAVLLSGVSEMVFAGISCGENLAYEIDGTKLLLTSPDPEKEATIQTEAFKENTVITTVSTPTPIDQVPSNQGTSSKVLRNGHMLILRNGTTYNLQGAPSNRDYGHLIFCQQN